MLISKQNPNVCRGKEELGGRKEEGGGRRLAPPCVRMDSVLNHLSINIPHVDVSVFSGQVPGSRARDKVLPVHHRVFSPCRPENRFVLGSHRSIQGAALLWERWKHSLSNVKSVVLVMDFKNALESI